MTRTENNQALLEQTTAIIVSYFSSHCFDALSQSLSDAPHLIVVDNSASPEEAQKIRRCLPNATVLTPNKNLGFGAANNLGIRSAATEFIALINPDCPATASDIAELVRRLKEFPDAIAAAPQLMDRHGKPDISYRMARTQWAPKGPGANGLVCVEYASGAMLVVRSAALRTISGFDEQFFLYYEDDDLCLRLTEQCGSILVDPAVKITHLSRQSSRAGWNTKPEFLRGFHHIQSKFLFQAKHSRHAPGLLHRWAYAFAAGLETMLRLMLLDVGRSARACGRCLGAISYRGKASTGEPK